LQPASSRSARRIYIERINAPLLFSPSGKGSEFGDGIRYAVEKRLMRPTREQELCTAAHHGAAYSTRQ
jgi:hypothetical protein